LSDPDALRRALAGPKRWRPFALRALLTLAVLAALVVAISPASILDAIRRAPPLVWAATAAGLFAGHIAAALKWRSLLQAAGTPCSASDALRAHGAGLFANLFLPSLVGGDVARAAALTRGTGGAAVASIAAGSVADRAIDTGALVSLAIAGAMLTGAGLSQVTFAGLCALAVGVALACSLGPRWIRRADFGFLPRRAAPFAAKLKQAAGGLADAPGTSLRAATVSLAIQLWFVALNAQLGGALGIDVPFAVWLLCWPLAKLLALAPVSLGGLGVREAALAALLARFGVEAALAVGQSLLWQAALISVGGVAGALALASTRLGRGGSMPRQTARNR